MMKLKQLLVISLFSVTALANANVKMEMFQMNRQMGSLVNASSIEEFTQSAKVFIESAEQARDKMPSSLQGEQARVEGYQQAMQNLIDTAKQANELAEQGKLEEAKEIAKTLNQLKKEGHSEYK